MGLWAHAASLWAQRHGVTVWPRQVPMVSKTLQQGCLLLVGRRLALKIMGKLMPEHIWGMWQCGDS